ncbi:MAG: hypothetical protein HC851_23060 [Acaryochloris sp. RU_4_1]|nr:hypothetical protein [Acaryochloris sp. RU_4_1]NJR57065.1 hypothetical protein [Acaryochloris sp. CRU_2_0]
MVTKRKAIKFATDLGWTQKDAERAYEAIGIDLNLVSEDDEFTLALTLADFAGEVLYERQRKQARQKGEVTKKRNEIKSIKLEYAEKIEQFEQDLTQERSLFVSLIARLYKFSQLFGLEDPWIEALLAKYQEYIQPDDSEQAA